VYNTGVKYGLPLAYHHSSMSVSVGAFCAYKRPLLPADLLPFSKIPVAYRRSSACRPRQRANSLIVVGIETCVFIGMCPLTFSISPQQPMSAATAVATCQTYFMCNTCFTYTRICVLLPLACRRSSACRPRKFCFSIPIPIALPFPSLFPCQRCHKTLHPLPPPGGLRN